MRSCSGTSSTSYPLVVGARSPNFERPVERRPRDAECATDGRDVDLPAGVEPSRQLELRRIGELLGSTPGSPSGAGGSEPGLGPLPDQAALELSQRPEDVEDELATGRGGVDLLGQALEADPPSRQGCDDLDQMLERAAQPAESPDDEGISAP